MAMGRMGQGQSRFLVGPQPFIIYNHIDWKYDLAALPEATMVRNRVVIF